MNKQLLLVLLLSFVLFQTHSQDALEDEFNDFRAKHGKTYAEHEARYRIHLYLKNKNKIDAHNADATQTWKMGTTKFADLSHEEFVYTHLTLLTPSIRLSQDTQEDLIV